MKRGSRHISPTMRDRAREQRHATPKPAWAAVLPDMLDTHEDLLRFQHADLAAMLPLCLLAEAVKVEAAALAAVDDRQDVTLWGLDGLPVSGKSWLVERYEAVQAEQARRRERARVGHRSR